MSRDQKLSPEEIVDSFKKEFAKKVTDTKVERHPIGPKKNEMIHIWMTVDRSSYRDVVKHLMTLDEQAHFAVSSGYDIEDRIEIINHFSIYFGERGEEISINFKVALPKSDPTMESICDLIPGALISEQEKQEMLGIKVKNIPKDMRVFISDDFPEDMYPWRKDEMNADKMGRNLHEHDKIPAAKVDKVEDDE
ncbi:MAG: NADH-quinone oxidoreductase subunit C [Candidatus Thermoplasmatota archaeon]|nr:NADH-quinone oxidoreductase subunit C [Candidatus Thermoplasmatota archaeon]MBS3802633.1 NADH-quinone oxidoreductase subunit C [Candidatus Thermoplasmatota archaeon]